LAYLGQLAEERSMEGWIKLHRKFNDWQWAKSPNHVALFVCLLTRANHKQTKWRTEVIKPGQLMTGRKQLSNWTGLTESQIRTILKDLKISGEIDQQTTRHYSIITITKWQTYQLGDQQIASSSPADRQLIATSKNANNEKNGENDYRAESNNTHQVKALETLPITPDDLADLFNKKFRGKLKPAVGLGSFEHYNNFQDTCRLLKTRSDWERLLDCAAEQEDFLIKKSKPPLTLTWLVKEENAIKVLEGKYGNSLAMEEEMVANFIGGAVFE